MRIIHDRKSSNMRLGSGEGDTGRRECRWVNDIKKEEDRGRGGWGGGDANAEPKTRDKETISLKRQRDEEFNNSGETDHMRVVHLH